MGSKEHLTKKPQLASFVTLTFDPTKLGSCAPLHEVWHCLSTLEEDAAPWPKLQRVQLLPQSDFRCGIILHHKSEYGNSCTLCLWLKISTFFEFDHELKNCRTTLFLLALAMDLSLITLAAVGIRLYTCDVTMQPGCERNLCLMSMSLFLC